MIADGTTDLRLESWMPVAPQSDFPIQNLPFGAFASQDAGVAHLGIAIGDRILDLHALARSGLLDETCERSLLLEPTLNALFGANAWRSVRSRVSALLRAGGDPALQESDPDRFFTSQDRVRMLVPVAIGDYVDFYSSLEHATNLGRIFRPEGEPLMPNWRWIPIGYHGRSATIVIDGTPVMRPRGQRKTAGAASPVFDASAMLDIELEVGFVTGVGNTLGEPIPIARADRHIAGLVLVNDWSARDVQAWEYQPLGPFLGKSFATTISPWIVTLDALAPFRVAGPRQEPAPLEYLRVEQANNYDVHLCVELQSERMRADGEPPQVISRTNFAGMYWNMAQQLAHATANGAVTRPGDLFASGTISGATPDGYGSLIEMTWRGQRPIALPNGETRAFLLDGDEITLRGWCERPNARRIGFGAARGRIVASSTR